MINNTSEQVILQPIGSNLGEKNFEKTVNNSIDLKDISKYIADNQEKNLLNIYPDKKIRIWGVQAYINNTDKKLSPNKAKWDKLKSGDKVLFYKDQKFIKSATITYVLWNKNIAKDLWSFNDSDETWECLYCLDYVKDIDIDSNEIFNLIESKERHVQGFRVLKESESKLILNKYKDL